MPILVAAPIVHTLLSQNFAVHPLFTDGLILALPAWAIGAFAASKKRRTALKEDLAESGPVPFLSHLGLCSTLDSRRGVLCFCI